MAENEKGDGTVARRHGGTVAHGTGHDLISQEITDILPRNYGSLAIKW